MATRNAPGGHKNPKGKAHATVRKARSLSKRLAAAEARIAQLESEVKSLRDAYSNQRMP